MSVIFLFLVWPLLFHRLPWYCLVERYPILFAVLIAAGDALTPLYRKKALKRIYRTHTRKCNIKCYLCNKIHNCSFVYICTLEDALIFHDAPIFLTQPTCFLHHPTSPLIPNTLRIPATFSARSSTAPRCSSCRRANSRFWWPQHPAAAPTRSKLLELTILQLHPLRCGQPVVVDSIHHNGEVVCHVDSNDDIFGIVHVDDSSVSNTYSDISWVKIMTLMMMTIMLVMQAVGSSTSLAKYAQVPAMAPVQGMIISLEPTSVRPSLPLRTGRHNLLTHSWSSSEEGQPVPRHSTGSFSGWRRQPIRIDSSVGWVEYYDSEDRQVHVNIHLAKSSSSVCIANLTWDDWWPGFMKGWKPSLVYVIQMAIATVGTKGLHTSRICRAVNPLACSHHML